MQGRKARLTQQICEAIAKDYIAPAKTGDALPHTAKLMRRYGVSRNTIRAAFKILQKAYNIRLQPQGKALVTKAGEHVDHWEDFWSRTIGIWPRTPFSWLEDTFCKKALGGLVKELRLTGMDLKVHIRDWNLLGQDSPIPHFGSADVAGLVVLEQLREADLIDSTKVSKPKVALDFDGTSYGLDSFLFDNGAAGELLARRLAKLGHLRIATLVESPQKPAAKRDAAWAERHQGFQEGLRIAKRPPPSEVFLQQRDVNRTGKADLERLLDLPPSQRPTAFCLPTSDYCLLLQELCRARRIRIPRDLTLVCYQDISAPGSVTGIRFDAFALGQQAARHLLGLIRDPKWAQRPRTVTRLKGIYQAGKTHARAPG